MTPAELRSAIKQIDTQIEALKGVRFDHMAALVAIYAKFDIGDIVTDGQRQFVITSRRLYSEESTSIEYGGKRLTKSGAPYNQRSWGLHGKLTLVKKAGAA